MVGTIAARVKPCRWAALLLCVHHARPEEAYDRADIRRYPVCSPARVLWRYRPYADAERLFVMKKRRVICQNEV